MNQTTLEVFSFLIIAIKNAFNSLLFCHVSHKVRGLDGQLHQLFLRLLLEIFTKELQILLQHLFRKLFKLEERIME